MCGAVHLYQGQQCLFVMQTAAPSSPSSAPRPSVFQGQAVATVIGGEAKRRKSEDTPRGFSVPSSETCMAPGNVRPLTLLPSFAIRLHNASDRPCHALTRSALSSRQSL